MSQSISTDKADQNRDTLEHAIAAFQRGDPVLIHDFDDREGEIDIVLPAEAVSPEDISLLRNDAGGLICVALAHDVATTLELPFVQQIIDHPVAAGADLGYDERSSFSLTVNHDDTHTGIIDQDRSKTITELGRIAENPSKSDFVEEFHSPGHVHLLKAAPDLLDDRRGHTELAVALAEAAALPGAAVVCEMLDDDTNEALSKTDARLYAERHGMPFVKGDQIVTVLG